MGEQEQLRWGRWGYLYENQKNLDGRTMETMGEQEQLRWGRWGYLYENQNNLDGDDGEDGRTRTIEMGTMGIFI